MTLTKLPHPDFSLCTILLGRGGSPCTLPNSQNVPNEV
jgi:hypothetical protein